MSLIITIAAFLVAIGILVTIHELGHYWAARLCNVKILRFSIGFGRTIFMKRHGPDQTEWAIAILPLGGFVKMADERDESVSVEDRARAFNNKTVWQRMFIIAAGPAANFVLAAILFASVFLIGQPGAIPFIAMPTSGSVAATAGFSEYDRIVKIDGNATKTWSEASLYLLDHAASRRAAVIDVQTRGGQLVTRQLPMDSIEKADLDNNVFLAKLGVMPYRLPIPAVIETVTANSVAATAGLKTGDKIVTVNGQPISLWPELVAIILKNPGKPVSLTVESRGELFDATVIPAAVTERGQTFGRIGVSPKIDRASNEALFTNVRYNPLESAVKGVVKVWEMSVFSLKMLGRMITGDISWKNLSGPITIADYAGQSAQMGLTYYLGFLALISVSIGVLNLLPIPVLDGGQLLYHIVEIIKGSPVSEQAMEVGQRIGLALLLGLTAFAFFNDIHRLVSG
jgi:regulator of sigma E protease